MPAQLNYYIFQMMRPLLTYGQASRVYHPLLLLLTCLAEEQRGIVWNVACKLQATEFVECEKECIYFSFSFHFSLYLSLSLSHSLFSLSANLM